MSASLHRLNRTLPLTPGFNPVCADGGSRNRFNGFPPALNKSLKRFSLRTSFVTGLKPGVNEKVLPVPAALADKLMQILRTYPLQQASEAPVSAAARPLDTTPDIILSESFDK